MSVFLYRFNTTSSLRIKTQNSTGSTVTHKVTKENQFPLDKFVFISCSPQSQHIKKTYTAITTTTKTSSNKHEEKEKGKRKIINFP